MTTCATAAEDIPCRIMDLPADRLVFAAADAVTVNPANAVPMHRLAAFQLASSTGPDAPLPDAGRLAFLTGKYWGAGGVRLSVGFLDTSDAALRRKILQYANSIGEWGNVVFTETANAQDADVRVARGESGYWSYLGTDIRQIPRGQATLNLQDLTVGTPESEWMRVVPHEFLHTCGAPHEHARLAIVQQIDRAKAIDYFRRTQGWSQRDVEAQVLTPLEERTIFGTETADEESIMTYWLPGSIMRDGQPVKGGSTFSASDKAFLARVYPKAIAPPVDPPPPPGPTVGGVTTSVDMAAKKVDVTAPAGWKITAKQS